MSNSGQPHRRQPSRGFSRQEHWNGLPFPSPMHESEKWKVKVKSLSRVRLLVTPWTAAYQAPPSMRFSRQEYWSGVPLPSPIRYSTSLIILKFLNSPQRRHQCNKHHSDYGDINSYICLVVLSLYRLNFTSLERSSIIKFLIEKYWADTFSTTPSELP